MKIAAVAIEQRIDKCKMDGNGECNRDYINKHGAAHSTILQAAGLPVTTGFGFISQNNGQNLKIPDFYQLKEETNLSIG